MLVSFYKVFIWYAVNVSAPVVDFILAVEYPAEKKLFFGAGHGYVKKAGFLVCVIAFESVI